MMKCSRLNTMETFKNGPRPQVGIIDEIIDLYHKHEFKIDDYMV